MDDMQFGIVKGKGTTDAILPWDAILAWY